MTEGQREKKRRQRTRRRVERIEKQIGAVIMCPYCQIPAKCVPDTLIYGKSYGGHIWWCEKCDARVGCHKGTYIAKGRLSNKALRILKVEAHALFDAFWRAAMELRGWDKRLARHKAYSWLSDRMGVPILDCHIGMFDEAQTRQAIAICKEQRDRTKVAA